MYRSGRSAPPRHLAGAPRPAPLPPPEPIDDDPQALLDAPRVPGHRLAFAVASTFAALPILVVDNLPAAADDAPAESIVVVEVAGIDAPVQLPAPTAAPTTAAPTAVAPTTTGAPTTTAAPTTTTAPPTTVAATRTTAAPVMTAPPTTVPPTTTTAPPEPAAAPAPTGNQESGKATWYRQPPRYAPGGCAHKTLPFGTVVTITAHADGATATCTVSDRGPYGSGRIIDLDDDVFVQLAPLSTGVIHVTITW